MYTGDTKAHLEMCVGMSGGIKSRSMQFTASHLVEDDDADDKFEIACCPGGHNQGRKYQVCSH